jgi:hypothetical protein
MNQPGLIYSIVSDNINHHWTVPPGATIRSGQGTNSIVVDWGSLPGLVSVNSFNDCGVSQYRAVEVSLRDGIAITGSGHTDIKVIDKTGASLFPNPAINNVAVRFNSTNQMSYTIELQNMNGSILMQKNMIATTGLNSFNIDISRYASGMYLVNIKNAERNIRLMLTKE